MGWKYIKIIKPEEPKKLRFAPIIIWIYNFSFIKDIIDNIIYTSVPRDQNSHQWQCSITGHGIQTETRDTNKRTKIKIITSLKTISTDDEDETCKSIKKKGFDKKIDTWILTIESRLYNCFFGKKYYVLVVRKDHFIFNEFKIW